MDAFFEGSLEFIGRDGRTRGELSRSPILLFRLRWFTRAHLLNFLVNLSLTSHPPNGVPHTQLSIQTHIIFRTLPRSNAAPPSILSICHFPTNIISDDSHFG